jgi:hypothetical protein
MDNNLIPTEMTNEFHHYRLDELMGLIVINEYFVSAESTFLDFFLTDLEREDVFNRFGIMPADDMTIGMFFYLLDNGHAIN